MHLQQTSETAVPSKNAEYRMEDAAVLTSFIIFTLFTALRKYGVPSIRSDLPAPKVRRVADWTNYGDVPGVWAVINPSVFSHHGVYERDVLQPRSRQEVRQLSSGSFRKIRGVLFFQQ